MAHGSRYHRRPGSLGPVAPNRVFKTNTWQDVWVATVQQFKTWLYKLFPEKNVILIKGNVPGAKKSLITIKSAVKAAK